MIARLKKSCQECLSAQLYIYKSAVEIWRMANLFSIVHLTFLMLKDSLISHIQCFRRFSKFKASLNGIHLKRVFYLPKIFCQQKTWAWFQPSHLSTLQPTIKYYLMVQSCFKFLFPVLCDAHARHSFSNSSHKKCMYVTEEVKLAVEGGYWYTWSIVTRAQRCQIIFSFIIFFATTHNCNI